MHVRRALLVMLMACAGCGEAREMDMAARRQAYHAKLVEQEATRQKAVDARKARRLRWMRRQRGW